jgi:hypothetical protein
LNVRAFYENGHSRFAGDVVPPLVRIGMPMHFAHPAGLELDDERDQTRLR